MAHPENRTRRRRKKSWLGRILFWCAGTVLLLVVAAAIAAPWILRAAVPEAFARLGMQASVTGGSLNVLRREVTLEGFTLGAPDAPVLSLGELGVGLNLLALTRGRIKLRHIRVRDVSMNAQRLLALQQAAETGPASGRPGLPVELDQLELEDVRLLSLGKRIGHDVRIDRLEVSDVSALLTDKTSKVDLQGAIGEGSVKLQLEVGLDAGKLRAVGKYRVDKVPVRGWAGPGSQQADPLSDGVVGGHGDIHIGYTFEAKSLDVTLDGRVALAGLGVDLAPLEVEHGEASWQGRLVLRWSPDGASLKLRGEGSLDVETLHLTVSHSSRPPVGATISDVSWQGDFDWRDGFRSEGAVLGTGVEVTGASRTAPAWRTHAEDFSWRLQVRTDGDSGEFGVRIQDFDLARFTLSVTGGAAPVDIVAEKLAVDEMRSAWSGALVLGRASVDALTVTASGGANTAGGATYRIGGLAAKGLSGDFSGELHAAHMSAESFDYADSVRQLRAEEIDFASVGFSAPAWVGADALDVKSVRVVDGQEDIWISGLNATRAHGDAGGGFGAKSIDVTHMFQSGSRKLSWEISKLKLGEIHGDVKDLTRVSKVDLGELKIGIDDTSWESSDLTSTDLMVTMDGDLKVASLGLAKLERRQPGTGDLRINGLAARGLRVHDGRAVLDGVKVARLDYQLPAGARFESHTLEARELRGDPSKGLEAGFFSVARGAGRHVNGSRLSAAALETRGLSVATDGGIAADKASLLSFSRTGPDTSVLDLQRLGVVALRWAPGDRLSVAKASLHAARYAGSGGTRWALAELATSKLGWDGGPRIDAELATLGSVSQLHAESPDWRAQELRATDFRLVLPGDVQIATLSAQSAHGGDGSPAWTVSSVTAEGLRSSQDHGQMVDSLTSGAVTVTDEGNGAALTLGRVAITTARISTLNELSAAQLLVDELRLASDKPDWPSRLTVAELWVAKPLLRFDGVVVLGDVVARSPYLIVAQSKDNAWMWPPLPGGGNGHGDEKGDKKGDGRTASNGGIRLASFSTRAPGRITFIDRATEPAFHLVLDPVVFAMENLDTTLPGNLSRFRVRGTGSRFSGLTLHGELRKRVGGFDLGLKVDMNGADLAVLNPYLARLDAFAVTAGRGDVDSDATIESDELSGQVNVLLSGLEMKSTSGGKAFKRVDPASVPIRTALALLRDRQGNISLTIPLQARTEEPRYDFIDSFQEDFTRAVTTAGQVAANLPGKTLDGAVRLLERTVSLLPGVSAERYPPIEFAPGRDDFTARPLAYLDQIGKRMGKQESLELVLCGRSVSLDSETVSGPSSGVDSLFAEASKGVYRIYAPGRDGLLALAAARADIVRRYLHEVHGVADRRLVACDAEIDAAPDAKARVELQVKPPAKGKGLFGLFP
jgi:hypothetical protein